MNLPYDIMLYILYIWYIVCIYKFYSISVHGGGHRGHDRMVVFLDLQLPMQSVPITTNVVSSNPVQVRCTRYNIM
jgi:hypothetical protein